MALQHRGTSHQQRNRVWRTWEWWPEPDCWTYPRIRTAKYLNSLALGQPEGRVHFIQP
jgi:hypothetical protein